MFGRRLGVKHETVFERILSHIFFYVNRFKETFTQTFGKFFFRAKNAELCFSEKTSRRRNLPNMFLFCRTDARKADGMFSLNNFAEKMKNQ